MTLPLEALRIAPVMVRAPSEARKAATRAVSATVGRRPRSVACSDLATTCSFETPSVYATFSNACWMVLVSTMPPERMSTTLTPAGPRSAARHLKSASMAPKAVPMAVEFGIPRAGIAVINRMTPECCCTRRDELRGDQGGERQQELLKGEFQGACPLAIVFCLWTYHIQEDINASPLLCHAIEVRLHCLLIKRVYPCGVGGTAVLVNLLSHLLNGGKPPTREKDRGPLGRKLFGHRRSDGTTCAKNDGVLMC